MQIIKNGTLTEKGYWPFCLECESKEGWVLETALGLWYCLPCIEKAFVKAQKEVSHA